MKHVVAINASPRTSWNTSTLVRAAAQGAASEGAEITMFDLYTLPKYSGCISCFGCKTDKHKGVCVCQDGLTPLLQAIQKADGLILGTPNYLGDATAAFRALYERLIFPCITYKKEIMSYSKHRIPVRLIMTSNADEAYYHQMGYDAMLERYQSNLTMFIGPTKVMVCGNTLQVRDYEPYAWTMFDAQMKQAHHDEVFPKEKQKAFAFGAEMVAAIK